MLQLQTIKLKRNTLLIEAHPVEVSEYIGTIKKTEERIEVEKASRVFRTGKVVLEGIQDDNNLTLLENFGERKTFVGETILFMAPSVNPLDIPIEGLNQPVIINSEYLISIIDESKSTPY